MTGGDAATLYWRGSVTDFATDVRALLGSKQVRDLAYCLCEMAPQPIPLLLHCPQCNERHLDEGIWSDKPHHTHACQECGHVWRPALAFTVGVRFLPGFKNEPSRVQHPVVEGAEGLGSNPDRQRQRWRQTNCPACQHIFKMLDIGFAIAVTCPLCRACWTAYPPATTPDKPKTGGSP